MPSPENDNEILNVQLTRRELAEIVDTLLKAEDLCAQMRQSEHEFKMQRMRLERARQSSAPVTPSEPPVTSTRFAELSDYTGLKKEP